MRTPLLLACAAALAVTGWSSRSGSASAHPGGLNAQGCHNNRKTGDYHCHGGAARSSPPASRPQSRGGTPYYANCSEVRAAGKAPLRRGDPGYAPHLDRDNDGIACE